VTGRGLVALAGAAIALASLAGGAGAAAKPHAARTPIKHFVVLMQANHSYDNYFGTYPRGDGIPSGVCMPTSVDRPEAGCVKPFALGARSVRDLSHNLDVFATQVNGGRMNGFVDSFRRFGLDGALTMGYYDDSDIPFYWNVADRFVLFDRFFSSAAGGSVWNHMYWASGTPGNPKADRIPAAGFGKLPLIFDRLQEAGVSWKFYVQNYDPKITYRSRERTDRSSQIVRVPPLNFARYLDDPKLFSRIVDLSEYYEDLAKGTLPAVAYIAPSGSSEHPPGSIQTGERFVRTLVNSLVQSRYWKDSAFMWTYDESGGWYDHVRPPRVDEFGYGFRVPALLVSPYARRGHVEHTTLDFTSILKFVEENWGVRPLARRDAEARSIAGAFDFGADPQAPAFLSAVRGAEPVQGPRRAVVYLAYGLAAGLTALLVVAALVAERRGRPRGPWRRAAYDEEAAS
jgi:phospholipase C